MYESIKTAIYVVGYGGCAAIAALCWGAVRFYRSTQYGRQVKAGLLKTIHDMGALGEFKLGLTLQRVLPGCRLLFNVYVPHGDGTYTECDCVALHEGRVYVFEMKNYSGWVFGRERDAFWTQSLNPRSRNRFLNPVKQNAGHIKALSEFSGCDAASFRSVVVFADRCELKKLDLTGSVPVVRRGELRGILPMVDEVVDCALDLDALYEKLYPCTQVSDEVKREHAERVTGKMSEKKKRYKY